MQLPFKQKEVDKLKQLRVTRSDEDFKNHLFEINVLGDLRLQEVLCDIEESTTKVDSSTWRRQIFIDQHNVRFRKLRLAADLNAVEKSEDRDYFSRVIEPPLIPN